MKPDSTAYPPRGMSREEAARYVGVGVTTFDRLIAEGRMPKPKRVGKRVIWTVSSSTTPLLISMKTIGRTSSTARCASQRNDASHEPEAGVSIVVASALLWSVAAAQVTDGDTLKQGGVTYRLWGIDAPELAQTCPDGWPAGRMAATRLQALTAGRSIVCQEKDRDRYGRTVAICRASGEDLGAIMVREGFAWAFTRFSIDYVDQQEEARRANRGVHEHDCQPAWEWRAHQRARSG